MLKNGITNDEIKKILSNDRNRKDYLCRFFKEKGDTSLDEKQINKLGKDALNEYIRNTWNYEVSKKVIREMFRDSSKYSYGESCKERMDNAINEWKNMGFDDFTWPYSARGFDGHIHKINRDDNLSGETKDRIVCEEVIRFRRIKEINQLRNDYIEYLMFNSSDQIIPTFGNKSGVDFYIEGVAYDQKVASTIDFFIKDYGDDYRKIAIEHPECLAKALYEKQDATRFGCSPRLYVVCLDQDISSDEVSAQLAKIDFENPYKIGFDFNHGEDTYKHYDTECFIVLLYHPE